ncbi:hypothetical protein P171DRAFT_448197 [Karstenula rhodostoma CBS 690.94]|uniref:C3H1-type domain-containing protein n=1 Tax=Karstenula rhodostoma CBS 690.94 TaxID=1392251 RepID=A0A9P4U5T1_9PLEO|nr:hypothetical protein P171DRAFT_448197 [Karstenula rhodostoma CBS 690.94]
MASRLDHLLEQVRHTHALRRVVLEKRKRDDSGSEQGDQDPTIVRTPRAIKKLRSNSPSTMPKALSTPVTGPRPIANRHQYVSPQRNVFREFRETRLDLPLTPPETPVTHPSSTDRPSENPASTDARQEVRLGNYIFPLHDKTKVNRIDFVVECARQAVETHPGGRENLRLAEEVLRLKEEYAEETGRLRKELAAQEQRYRTERFEPRECLQQELDSEKEELDRKLKAAEKALAVERQAKEDLQNQLATERQAKRNSQSELVNERQAKLNLQTELSSEQKSTKALKEDLVTVRQEKEDLSKARTKEAQDHSTKHDKLEKEKKDLTEKFTAERKKTQDLEKSNIRHQEQYQRSVKENDQIKDQTVAIVKHHLLKGLVGIFAETCGVSSLTAENIAPELHPMFFDTIDGTTTWQQLTLQVANYYEQHPQELAKILGSNGQGVTTVGNTYTPGNQGNPFGTESSRHGVGLPTQPAQDPVSVTKTSAFPVPQPQTTDWQQPPQTYAPVSQTDDFENQPEDMETETTQSTTQMPIAPWIQPSAAQQTFDNGAGYATPDQRPLCKFIHRPGGCKWGETCKFSHAGDENGVVNDPADPMVVETPDQRLPCKFIHRPGGCKWGESCKFSHAGDQSSWIQPSAAQQPSTFEVAGTATDPMVVETSDQRPLCKSMLYPRGCKRRETCKDSHPGDYDCGIAQEAVNILDREVIPAKRALSQAETEQAEAQAKVQFIRAYYKYIVQMFESARQASLNRENRIRFLVMMDYHIRNVLALEIDSAKPDLVHSLNLPKDGFLAAARSIDGWFGPDYNMPTEAQVPWKTLEIFNEDINEKLNRLNQLASSTPEASTPTMSRLEQGLDEILAGAAGTRSSRRDREPIYQPQSPPGPSMRGRINGSQLSHSGQRIHGDRLNLAPIEKEPFRRQPPRGPHLQSLPATPERDFYSQERQQNAARRTTVHPTSQDSQPPTGPRVQPFPAASEQNPYNQEGEQNETRTTAPTANAQPDDMLRVALDLVALIHDASMIDTMAGRKLSPAAKVLVERVATGELDVATADQHIRRLLK